MNEHYIHKSHVLKLYPTKSQEVLLKKSCGLIIDRDLNAAINLAEYSPTQETRECEACGELSSVAATQFSDSEKQEININT